MALAPIQFSSSSSQVKRLRVTKSHGILESSLWVKMAKWRIATLQESPHSISKTMFSSSWGKEGNKAPPPQLAMPFKSFEMKQLHD